MAPPSQGARLQAGKTVPDKKKMIVFMAQHATESIYKMMMIFFICSCRNKKQEPITIYTLRKVRTIM
jgi:hypothetical protein